MSYECIDPIPGCISCDYGDICTGCSAGCSLSGNSCSCPPPELPQVHTAIIVTAVILGLYCLLLLISAFYYFHLRGDKLKAAQEEAEKVKSPGERRVSDRRGGCGKVAKFSLLFCHLMVALGITMTVAGVSLGGTLRAPYEPDQILVLVSYLGIGFMVFFYVLILVYGAFYGACRSITKASGSDEAVGDYVAAMRRAQPVISVYVDCYHTESSSRTVTDSDGNTSTETTTYDVTSYSETVPFRYTSCTDSTADISSMGPCVLLKLTSKWSYVLGDSHTKQVLERMKVDLKELHRHRDSMISVTERLFLPGFEVSKTFLSSQGMPYFLKRRWQFLSSVFLMGFFYEVWAERLSQRKVFKITKTVILA